MGENMNAFDQGWVAYYQGKTPHDNLYRPENIRLDEYESIDDPGHLPGIIVDIKDTIDSYASQYNKWARGYEDAKKWDGFDRAHPGLFYNTVIYS